MAEFCKRCFIQELCVPRDNIDHIVMSNESDFCECCGKHEPIVLYIDSSQELKGGKTK